MNSEHHYNAFISYRHAELDSAVAVALHRKLERFRLPANLHKSFPKDRWKINRVFRDQDELPLSDNLSEPIEEAIRNSDFLIVICTPRLPESMWCAREIELFKKFHGQDHILAILAEGEPEQSFPKGICYRDVEETDENGNKVIKKQPVEPLAADVRAIDARKRNKLLDDAVLRLAAPMYGLGYDDLKQRHREQKIKRIAAVSTVAAGIFFAFGMVCMSLSMKISAQKRVIEEQYITAQRKYAEAMSVVSDTLLKEGRQKDAVYAVRSVMPETTDDKEPPYVASAHYSLCKSLGKYEMNVFFPYDIMPLPDPEDEDYWGDPGEYRAFEKYLGDQLILCAGELTDQRVLLVTTDCKLYVYDPSANTLLDYTSTWFSEEPGKNVTAAAYRDGMLYLCFSDSDYVAVYKWTGAAGQDTDMKITRDDLRKAMGSVVPDGEEVLSDDGKYRIVTGANHTVMIYENEGSEPVKIIYDLRGGFTGLRAMEGTDGYLLTGAGKYSYLLDTSFNIIARIPYFYREVPDEASLLLYEFIPGEKDYKLFKVPVAGYRELIEEADALLYDHTPDVEILERYGILEQEG